MWSSSCHFHNILLNFIKLRSKFSEDDLNCGVTFHFNLRQKGRRLSFAVSQLPVVVEHEVHAVDGDDEGQPFPRHQLRR